MKRILIVNYYFKVGGISTSLNNLLHNLEEDLIEKNTKIDLFLLNPDIEDKYIIPNNVNILYPNWLTKTFFSSLNKNIKHGDILQKIVSIMLVIFAELLGYERLGRIVLSFEKELSGYDYAISFTNDIFRKKNFFCREFSGGCNYFVLNKVKANKKIGWIHNDVEKLRFTSDYARKTYRDFDKIVNVSVDCKEKFDNLVPQYRYKSVVIGNTFLVNEIREKSNSFKISRRENCLNFVTVARIDNQQKKIERVIYASKRLKEEGYKFFWHIIGSGEELDKFINIVKEDDLSDVIKFYGYQPNPYPYLKDCDLMVLPSLYEAQGMVIIESIILGTPVLVSEFKASKEFVSPEIGKIVNNSSEGVYTGLKEILDHDDILNSYKNNIVVNSEVELNNCNEIMKIKKIVGLL